MENGLILGEFRYREMALELRIQRNRRGRGNRADGGAGLAFAGRGRGNRESGGKTRRDSYRKKCGASPVKASGADFAIETSRFSSPSHGFQLSVTPQPAKSCSGVLAVTGRAAAVCLEVLGNHERELALGPSPRFALFAGFGVISSAQQYDHGREKHPNEQAYGGREAAIHHVVGHLADVPAEGNIHRPPEDGGHGSARQQVAKSRVAGPSDSVEQNENGHGQYEYSDGVADPLHVVSKVRRGSFLNQPRACLFAKHREDHDQEHGHDGETQQTESAGLAGPIVLFDQIAFDHAKALHQAGHRLRAGKERAAQPQRDPAAGMHRPAHEILGDDPGAAGRKNRHQAVGYFADRLGKKRSVAQQSEREQQQREKREEHVEGDGLTQRDAIRKDPPEGSYQIAQYTFYCHRRRLYGNSCDSQRLFRAPSHVSRLSTALARPRFRL